jgi:CheY-like chemotaxis protein
LVHSNDKMSLQNMKPVWIVDDDRSIRWVLEKTLSREGIPFKSFASASEAISQLEQGIEPPQVLMSDIRMPGQSGLELLQEVKTRFPSAAGHHHDGLFRSGKRRCRVSGRGLRIPAQALRRRSGCRADPARD